MSYLVDHEIAHLCSGDTPLISPFVAAQERAHGVSHGLSSCGYDLRLGNSFTRYRRGSISVIGPTHIDNSTLDTFSCSDHLILEPGQSILAHTVEYIRMPPTLVGFIQDKSTWARLFLDAKNTQIEPGWEGQITLELSNRNPNQLALPIGCGIVQIAFAQLSSIPRRCYRGKYHKQLGVTPPRTSAP